MIAIRCTGLLLDLDGVLIDSTPAVARVWQRWAMEHGFDPKTVVRMAHGRPSRTTIRELLLNAHTDIDCAVLDKEDRGVERREMEDLDGVVLLPGARQLLNSLPPDAEIAPEWDAFIASLGRTGTQARIRTLFERGFHKPGDVETRLGYHVGLLGAR